MNKKTFLFFFGPQGSGKGTQAELLNKKLRLVYICPGQLLRKEIAAGTKLGKKVKAYYTAGKLVPNKITNTLVAKKIKSARRGAILDGYPRNKIQQKALLRILPGQGKDNARNRSIAILIDINKREVLRRLSKRRVCSCGEIYHLLYNPPKRDSFCDKCGRKLLLREDDKPEAIKKRLKIYEQKTKPLLAFWRQQGKLITIDGLPRPNIVFMELTKKLKAAKIL